MGDLQLYNWYSRDDIIAHFGSQDRIQGLCDGQWLIFPTTIACLATLGEPAAASHFDDASLFCWVANRPYRVNDRSWSNFVPAQVVGPGDEKYARHLFVQPQCSERYLYVGEFAPSYRQQSPSGQNHGMAWFKLKPTLPSAVWVELGGFSPGDLNFDQIDLALDRLRHPTIVQDRLDVLHQLVEFWHGPIRPEDGMTDAEIGGVPLPRPLRYWYRWAGKRREVMSRQNILFMPHECEGGYAKITVRNGRLLFYAENQGVYQWATLPGGNDPQVFGRYEGRGPWAEEGVTLSEHLILMCLFEAVMCHAKYSASIAWLEEEKFAAIARRIPPLAIPPWRWVRTRFFARQGAFMLASENGLGKPYGTKRIPKRGKRYFSVHIGAKTETPLQFLKPHIDKKWNYVAL